MCVRRPKSKEGGCPTGSSAPAGLEGGELNRSEAAEHSEGDDFHIEPGSSGWGGGGERAEARERGVAPAVTPRHRFFGADGTVTAGSAPAALGFDDEFPASGYGEDENGAPGAAKRVRMIDGGGGFRVHLL